MKTTQSIIAQRTNRFVLNFLGQLVDLTVLPFGSTSGDYYVIGSTTSTTFVTLYTAKYTIDTYGKITVIDIGFVTTWNNDADARSKLQVSGNGGATFIDVTDEIPGGAGVQRNGPGLWITEILPGIDMLQIRILGRSTTGASQTVRCRVNSSIDPIYFKKLV